MELVGKENPDENSPSSSRLGGVGGGASPDTGGILGGRINLKRGGLWSCQDQRKRIGVAENLSNWSGGRSAGRIVVKGNGLIERAMAAATRKAMSGQVYPAQSGDYPNRN